MTEFIGNIKVRAETNHRAIARLFHLKQLALLEPYPNSLSFHQE
jgi:hypothetical protein